MDFIHLRRIIRNKLRHIPFGIIFIFIISCTKLPCILTGKHKEQDNKFLSSQSKKAKYDTDPDPQKVQSLLNRRDFKTLSWLLNQSKFKKFVHLKNLNKDLVKAIKDVNLQKFNAILDSLKSFTEVEAYIILNIQDCNGFSPIFWCLEKDILERISKEQRQDYAYMFESLFYHKCCNHFLLDEDGANVLQWVVLIAYLEALDVILKGPNSELAKWFMNHKDYNNCGLWEYLNAYNSKEWSKERWEVFCRLIENPMFNVNSHYVHVSDISCDSESNSKRYLCEPHLYQFIRDRAEKPLCKLLRANKLDSFIEYIGNELCIGDTLDFFTTKKINNWKIL